VPVGEVTEDMGSFFARLSGALLRSADRNVRATLGGREAGNRKAGLFGPALRVEKLSKVLS